MKKWLFLISFLLTAGNVHALTLSEILAQVRRNIRDTSTSTSLQRYSDSVLTEYVNEAQREVVNLTWCVEKSTSYALTPATTYYALPSDVLGINQVLFVSQDGTNFVLSPITEVIQYQTAPDFERSSIGQPFQYFVRTSTYTAQEIAYVPVADSASTGTVTISYAAQPADLSGVSDVPFSGMRSLYPYHGSIVAKATSIVKQIENKTDEASIYYQMFDRYLAEMKDKNGAMPSYLPSARGTPK